MKAVLFAVLLTVSPLAARAQERPQTLPTRDVDITYRITRGGQVLQERTRWMVAQALQRIDPPGNAIYMLMDHRSHHAEMVDDTRRTVLDMAASTQAGPLEAGSSASFVRQDEAVIAGIPCTNWQTNGGGAAAVLCITADGALLRVQTAGQTLVEATAVSYAPADVAAFTVPPDYAHVAPAK